MYKKSRHAAGFKIKRISVTSFQLVKSCCPRLKLKQKLTRLFFHDYIILKLQLEIFRNIIPDKCSREKVYESMYIYIHIYTECPTTL